MSWLAWMLGLFLVALGALLALGMIPPEPWDALLGMFLGCLCILGAAWATS